MTFGQKISGPLASLLALQGKKKKIQTPQNILVQMNRTASLANLPYFSDSKMQTSSHCNTAKTWTSHSQRHPSVTIGSPLLPFLTVRKLAVPPKIEQRLRRNEMYRVYDQTHHPSLKMLLLMASNTCHGHVL